MNISYKNHQGKLIPETGVVIFYNMKFHSIVEAIRNEKLLRFAFQSQNVLCNFILST